MRKLLISFFCLVAGLYAGAYAPQVTMSIRLPDGQTRELTARESGMVTVAIKDGREFGFRPTMQDDKGTHISVTIFNMGTATTALSELGEVETGVGKPAVESKTSPAFRIAVRKVADEVNPE
ncbi:MAG TPA: hypothetical protein VG273_17525 [Bryobacteraceae bacterium]|jgi:hypothetical protein|nr:hypothetical protein [Bryobacteraceae bacterium]